MAGKKHMISRLVALGVGMVFTIGLLWTSPAVANTLSNYIETIPFDVAHPVERADYE
ncbi:MAG: hypothetical protein FWE05_07660 [Defluviitaleaceae bacterium]|nr:hypothetical protein [Defluviitaleaceae bacterium]